MKKIRITEQGAKVAHRELGKWIAVRDRNGAHLPDDQEAKDIREAHRELGDRLRESEAQGEG